jgi:hypothetical protein
LGLFGHNNRRRAIAEKAVCGRHNWAPAGCCGIANVTIAAAVVIAIIIAVAIVCITVAVIAVAVSIALAVVITAVIMPAAAVIAVMTVTVMTVVVIAAIIIIACENEEGIICRISNFACANADRASAGHRDAGMCRSEGGKGQGTG